MGQGHPFQQPQNGANFIKPSQKLQLSSSITPNNNSIQKN